VATAGGRCFGFVIGGSLPAALVANWLAGAWDQNAAMQVMSPVAAKLEEIALEWIVDVLGLPSESGAGFVTGTTMANFSALAAARTALMNDTPTRGPMPRSSTHHDLDTRSSRISLSSSQRNGGLRERKEYLFQVSTWLRGVVSRRQEAEFRNRTLAAYPPVAE